MTTTKKGMDLGTLTSELEYQNENRNDFRVGTKDIMVYPDRDTRQWSISFTNDEGNKFIYPLTSHALAQIANYTKFSYATLCDIMRKGTDVERLGLGEWLTTRLQQNPASRLIRTVGRFWEDPKAVAFVESSFMCRTSFSVLTALLGLALEIKGLKYASGDLTDAYMTVQMLGDEKDGIACGIQFDWSEVGSPSLVRPVFVTDKGHTVIPQNHWITIDDVDPVTAKQCVTGSRAAVKKYTDCMNRFIPEGVDIRALLTEEYFLEKEAVRKIMGHFVKFSERSQQSLVNAIAKYAQTAQSLSYGQTIELECAAGKALDLNDEIFQSYYNAELAQTAPAPKETNGK